MKQALILMEEINRKKEAMEKTKSPHLKNDYGKSIKDDLKELKIYCKYKGLDYGEVTGGPKHDQETKSAGYFA